MAVNTITSYPSLTSSWTPSSSCVTSTGFWYVVYASNVVFSDMFGMPSVTNTGQGSSPTGGCVPPSYTLSVPYLTDGGCPTHYSRACSTATLYSDRLADYIMCCPMVLGWNFNCAAATDDGPVPYGCQATFAEGDIIIGSRTDLVASTGQAETHTVGNDHGVNAWGIALLSTPSRTSSSTTVQATSSKVSTSSAITTFDSASASTPTSTSPPQSLGTGAAAGIGVGVGVGVFAALGLLTFWCLRRKRKANQGQPNTQNYQNQGQAVQNGQSHYAPPGSMEFKQQNNHGKPAELENQPTTYEMPS
ncbi:hypothetical protein NUW58_g4999 [Xylaria curta]|uniref:Uncharacterized protein n=1 Tax=Xylaria curta TaxID=42375 RepID=A0ACC1P3T1_9PEZI|nr:hypothetical protein NUW58_g4999 [Xylaria curta]